jgi:uncharacterized protein (TIGR04222 family)
VAENQGGVLTLPLNPLDWTAEPFLTLFIVVVALAVLIVLAMRLAIKATPAASGYATKDQMELAWLTGGRRRATDTVLVAFLESGSAKLEGRQFEVDMSGGSLPSGFLRFAGYVSASQSVADFRRAIQPGLDEISDTLAARGLVPSRAQLGRLDARTKAIFAVPLALGLLKCIVGMSRDRPIGILIVLLFITFGIALWLVRHKPFVTQAGETAAADAQQGMARAARAPEENEMVLAFALSGAAVLAGRSYAPLLRPSAGSASGCGGSGCGGGDGGGGGGCGGCSGGGGC